MQRILATIFSKRCTFDARCGLIADLNLEAARVHGAVWKSSDIIGYTNRCKKTATTATDNNMQLLEGMCVILLLYLKGNIGSILHL